MFPLSIYHTCTTVSCCSYHACACVDHGLHHDEWGASMVSGDISLYPLHGIRQPYIDALSVPPAHPGSLLKRTPAIRLVQEGTHVIVSGRPQPFHYTLYWTVVSLSSWFERRTHSGPGGKQAAVGNEFYFMQWRRFQVILLWICYVFTVQAYKQPYDRAMFTGTFATIEINLSRQVSACSPWRVL